MEINKYFLSQHFGICAGADALLALTIKEKPAWSGRVTEQSEFVIDRPDLFGGSEKEGGVEGVIHYLPGASDQLLSTVLAHKLGRSSGADCPGFRGLASIFCTGPRGTTQSGYAGWGDQTRGKRGFYWAANNPYLPGIWATVERAPVGLDPEIAMIGELGDNSEPEHAGIELAHGWEYDPAEVTVRIQLERSALGGCVAGKDIRFSFKAGYLGLKVSKCYIGINGGDIYDFAAPPTQVFFNDGAPGFDAEPDEVVFCDWVEMPYGADDNIVWSLHIAPGDPDTFRVYTNAVADLFTRSTNVARIHQTIATRENLCGKGITIPVVSLIGAG